MVPLGTLGRPPIGIPGDSMGGYMRSQGVGHMGSQGRIQLVGLLDRCALRAHGPIRPMGPWVGERKQVPASSPARAKEARPSLPAPSGALPIGHPCSNDRSFCGGLRGLFTPAFGAVPRSDGLTRGLMSSTSGPVHQSPQGRRCPPGPATHQMHECRQQPHPYQRGVDQHRERQTEAEHPHERHLRGE